MVILDTNVVSALMVRQPHLAVVEWLNRQKVDEVWTTAITILEVRSGILLLPDGRRKQGLATAFSQFADRTIATRILPFDTESAEAAAALSWARIQAGINKKTLDTQIAGIAIANRATLATRNIKDFADLDLRLVNPWDA